MREFLANTRAFALAVAIHIIMAAVVVLGTMSWKPFKPPAITGMTIEAVMVDTGAIKARKAQAEKEAREAVQREQARVQREKQLQERREELKEQQAQAAREKAQAEAAEKERLRVQAQQKREEDIRLQKMREKQEADRKAADARVAEELQNLREKREKAAKEAKLQEERLKQMEARKQAEADKQRQAEDAERMRQQMAAEENAAAVGSLRSSYEGEIRAIVTSNWLRPPTAQTGLKCKLGIVQIPGGQVISASIVGFCNADEATKRSLTAAVERAGNLPYRGYEEVFQREIDFVFTYDED